MTLTEEDPKAQKRMQVILDHLADRLNATEASLELGVSRKTFYEWLDRARMGMFQALRDKPTGRPPDPVDPEKAQLQELLETVEKERTTLASRLRVQEVMQQTMKGTEASGPKKKPAES